LFDICNLAQNIEVNDADSKIAYAIQVILKNSEKPGNNVIR